MTRIVVLSAGVGEPSTTRMLADRLAAAATAALSNSAAATEMGTAAAAAELGTAAAAAELGTAGASVEMVNLRDLAHEITDAALTGFAAPRLQHVYDQVLAADAIIVAVPTFKASYPGLFKSFIDALDNDALVGKVVLLAATGGTARHSLVIDFALRPLFSYLQAVVVPTGVFASPHDWGSSGDGALQSRIERAAAELASLLGGQGSGRIKDDEIDLFSPTMLSISQAD